jgi:hypothetical protein
LPTALLYCHPAPEDSPYDPTSVTFYNHAGLIAALRSLGFTDVVCRNVMLSDDLSYGSWEEFASSPHVTDGTVVNTARAIYTATRATHMNEHLNRYWFGTHTLHLRDSDSEELFHQYNCNPGLVTHVRNYRKSAQTNGQQTAAAKTGLAVARTEATTAQTEAAAARAEAAAAKADAAAAKAELAAIRASTSWRVTRPLRQLVSILRDR